MGSSCQGSNALLTPLPPMTTSGSASGSVQSSSSLQARPSRCSAVLYLVILLRPWQVTNYPRYRWTFKSPLRALPARVDNRRRLTLRCTKSSSISASPTARGILPRVSRGAERMEVFKMRSDSSQPGRRYASRPAPNCATPHLCRPSYVSDSSLNASGADAHLAIAACTPYLDLF